MKGIGDSSAKKIIELLETGKLEALEELIAKTPAGILDMMQIKGLGPKKICTIWKEMGIESIGELLYACNENRLLLYKGFGEKTQQNVAEAIEFFMRHQGHFLYAEVESYAVHMHRVLQENFPGSGLQHTGGFARQLPTLEFLEWTTDISQEKINDFFKQNGFTVENGDGETTAIGEEQIRMIFKHCIPVHFTSHVFFLS